MLFQNVQASVGPRKSRSIFRRHGVASEATTALSRCGPFTVAGSWRYSVIHTRAEALCLSLEPHEDDLANKSPRLDSPECLFKNISRAAQRVRWWPGVS